MLTAPTEDSSFDTKYGGKKSKRKKAAIYSNLCKKNDVPVSAWLFPQNQLKGKRIACTGCWRVEVR